MNKAQTLKGPSTGDKHFCFLTTTISKAPTGADVKFISGGSEDK